MSDDRRDRTAQPTRRDELAPAVRSLAQRPWVDLMPWLAGYRHGPPILSDTEVIPNAWLTVAPADSLNPENFGRFCDLVAERYVTDRHHAGFAADFPALTTTGSLSDVELTDDAEKLLSGNAINTTEALSAHSASELLDLPGSGRSAAVEIVAGLVALTARAAEPPIAAAQHTPLDRDRHVMAFIDGLDDRGRLILDERIVASRPRTQTVWPVRSACPASGSTSSIEV